MTASLRWLLLATHVPASGSGGGMVRYVVEMARALDQRSDVELHVLAASPAVPFFRSMLGESRVHTVPDLPTPARSALERSALVPALRRPWDVVQGAKHLLPRKVTGRSLLTVHDMLVFDRPTDFSLLKRTALRRPYLQALREADVLLCVSNATRDRLVQHLPGVAGRAVVVPHAGAPSLHQSPSQEVPELRGRPFALVVGDPSPRKNLGFALKAWQYAQAGTTDVVLAVVGPSGWGVTEGLHAAESERVSWLGHIPEGQLRWAYENARVVLCPSLLEGFGLPALEALQFGAPVITSSDPALVEVSGEDAEHLPAVGDDAARLWAERIRYLLSAPVARRPAPEPPLRDWTDVAGETVEAVRRAGCRD